MKKLYFASCLLLMCQLLFAQTKLSDLMLDKKGKPYLQHTVAAKESFSSLAKMYNLSAKSIATYNNLNVSKALTSGKQIKIPLNNDNFWQDGKKGEDEVLVPLYVKTASNTTLKDLSKKYKADKSSLKTWNTLKKEDVKKGSRLIVGYLMVEKNSSSLAKKAVKVKKETDVAKKDSEEKNTNKEKEQAVTSKTTGVKTPDKKTDMPEGKKGDISENKKAEPVVESKKTEEPIAVYQGEGIFKKEYEQQLQSSSESKVQAFTAGVFKSTSGWNDGKFYVIINDVPVGTIVLVKHIESGKFVYAKVLTSINEAKPQGKEEVLISAAAAAQLDVKNNAFTAELFWSVE